MASLEGSSWTGAEGAGDAVCGVCRGGRKGRACIMGGAGYIMPVGVLGGPAAGGGGKLGAVF